MKRHSPTLFVQAAVQDVIDEMHSDGLPCQGDHSSGIVGFVEYLIAVKPGKPLTYGERLSIWRRVALITQGECPAYRVTADVINRMIVEMEVDRKWKVKRKK